MGRAMGRRALGIALAAALLAAGCSPSEPPVHSLEEVQSKKGKFEAGPSKADLKKGRAGTRTGARP
ncbi:MAG: hypothetical protein U0800_03005 [Isosphaeraceae bacterium]